MEFHSFLTSLGTSLVIFVILMVLFAWLSTRQGNVEVYYPNRILKGLDPWEGRSRTRNPFSWIREALTSSEQDVISMAGVDAAVYFVFLTTALGILVLSGMLFLPLLLPVAATDHSILATNTTSNGTFSDLDKLSMGHIEPNSSRLWAYVIATYWISFVAYYLLWKAYKHVSDLRADALKSPEVRAEQFAVLVRDIPPPPEGQTRKEQVDSYFKMIYPETFYRSMVVTNNRKANKIFEKLQTYKKKLARAEAIYTGLQKEGKSEGTRPSHRTGFLGLVGKKVDSIEFYNEKINELTKELKDEQETTVREKQEASALVFFIDRKAAASAAQSLHAQMVDTWTVMDAPEPRQLIWSNLPKRFYEREVRQYLIYVIVFLTIAFYMIPIGLISAFTTLDNLKKILPFMKSVVDKPAIKTVLEAYLPQLALIVFLALLPKFLLCLSKAEGIPSESHATRAAAGKYFYFSVLNVFIGVTVGGTIVTAIKKIEKDPNSLVPTLAESLPDNATFFLTFVALKFFVGYGLELSRLVPLIIFRLKKKYLCKTEDEVKEAWAPGDLGYETRVPSDMLIMAVVLCYSVITPLIIPFGVAYFGLGWLILRNQALKVYVPRYESYGRMWPHIHTRIVACFLLFQLTMVGYFGVKKFHFTPVIVPLPILSVVFAFVCRKKFYRFFQSTALEVASYELKETPNMELIFRSFVAPSLNNPTEKSDDKQQHQHFEHFEDALSQASRTGSTV